MLRITRMNHFNIVTQDLEASARFYERLGLVRGPRPDFGNSGAWMYIGPDPVVHLNLESEMPYETTHGRGVVNHLGFDVHGTMEYVCGVLTTMGIKFRVYPREVPGWFRALYFEGPSGEEIEFVLKDCYVEKEALITVHQVLDVINTVRQMTCPPKTGETVTRGIDEITAVDGILLGLQEKLLDDYGDRPQSTTF